MVERYRRYHDRAEEPPLDIDTTASNETVQLRWLHTKQNDARSTRMEVIRPDEEPASKAGGEQGSFVGSSPTASAGQSSVLSLQ
jgi:hypothetical protein